MSSAIARASASTASSSGSESSGRRSPAGESPGTRKISRRRIGHSLERHSPASRSSGSSHPTGSFCARGPLAGRVVESQPLSSPFAAFSPPEALYELGAEALLLGVDHSRNTCLHYAEHLADFPGKRLIRKGSAVMEGGRRRWVEYETLAADDGDFAEIGRAYETLAVPPAGRVGAANARLVKLRPLIDFAAAWMETHRRAPAADEDVVAETVEAVR